MTRFDLGKEKYLATKSKFLFILNCLSFYPIPQFNDEYIPDEFPPNLEKKQWSIDAILFEKNI